MEQDTFAKRLRTVMERKNLNTVELAKLAGVSRQSISYILNKDLKESRLSLKFALALNVSYDWLAKGIEDQTFVEIFDVLVFSQIYELLNYISTKQTSVNIKAITSNKKLESDSFVFNPLNTTIYYYCLVDNSIESSKYLTLDVENTSFNITTKRAKRFSYPIIEIREVLS